MSIDGACMPCCLCCAAWLSLSSTPLPTLIDAAVYREISHTMKDWNQQLKSALTSGNQIEYQR